MSGLTIEFRTRAGIVHAIEEVGFSVRRGETVGLVGESGSGKSVTAYAVMGLLDPAGKVTHGLVEFEGRNLLATDEMTMRRVRGREISMIFQDPRAALNPVRTVGRQIEDVLLQVGGRTRAEVRSRTHDLLAMVRIPDPARRARSYPFELSGGMCQRVVIALAMACEPKLLIADEPTTGLDVTTQSEIMELVESLARTRGMATVFITHDLGLAAEHCDRLVVMHAGHVVEIAPTDEIFRSPKHPYSVKLIAATPHFGRTLDELESIPGGLPDLRRADLPPCRYASRCERKRTECDIAPLSRVHTTNGRFVACRFPL